MVNGRIFFVPDFAIWRAFFGVQTHETLYQRFREHTAHATDECTLYVNLDATKIFRIYENRAEKNGRHKKSWPWFPWKVFKIIAQMNRIFLHEKSAHCRLESFGIDAVGDAAVYNGWSFAAVSYHTRLNIVDTRRIFSFSVAGVRKMECSIHATESSTAIILPFFFCKILPHRREVLCELTGIPISSTQTKALSMRFAVEINPSTVFHESLLEKRLANVAE